MTADQAAGRGYGSNRDFAQIMALCHMDGITARYVTGILPGKTELHSWVEKYRRRMEFSMAWIRIWDSDR